MMRRPPRFYRRSNRIVGHLAALLCLITLQIHAQATNAGIRYHGANMPPMKMDNGIFAHVLFNQLEGRASGAGAEFRWDSEGWFGTDRNRIWLKSEGVAGNGSVSDGDQEILYDRPLPRLRYFDLQAGVRDDLDSGPNRTWGAIGIEGMAPYFFELAPTFYFRNGGNVAGRIEGSYDLLLTQRLVAQPQIEMNFYNKDDHNRGVGSGLAEIDTGLRLRYEFRRKFAPYVGYAYNGKFGSTAQYARQSGEATDNSSFVFGLRVWY